MVAVLFVCLGNICRSPAAEGILKQLATQEKIPLHVESRGLGDWHLGQLPDVRMREAAGNRGVLLASRAKKIDMSDFDNFDYILVADQKILTELYRHAHNPEHKAKIHLMTHYSPCYKEQPVPDPYYEGDAGFEHVLNMLEDSCQGLISHIRSLGSGLIV
jgi:protein-tyrosine phosphatase